MLPGLKRSAWVGFSHNEKSVAGIKYISSVQERLPESTFKLVRGKIKLIGLKTFCRTNKQVDVEEISAAIFQNECFVCAVGNVRISWYSYDISLCVFRG